MALHRFVVIVLVVLLCGCGGGGSSPSTSGNDTETPTVHAAAVTRQNGDDLMWGAFYFTSLTNWVAYNMPNLAYSILMDTGGGDVNEEYPCNESHGAFSIIGNFSSEDGTGSFTLTYRSCEATGAASEINGDIRVVVTETDEDLFPIRYTVNVEDYAITPATGEGISVSGDFAVNSLADGGRVVTLDAKASPLTDTSRYIETSDMEITYAVPAGFYPTPDEMRASGTVNNTGYGTVTVSTEASFADNVTITGAANSNLAVHFVAQEYISAALDANGDQVGEAFIHTFLAELGDPTQENYTPEVEVAHAIEQEEGNTAVLSLLEVTDPDSDFLTYSLSVAEAPSAAQVDWSFENGENLRIDADLPGDYLLDLTVDDGNGGVVTEQIALTISPYRNVE